MLQEIIVLIDKFLYWLEKNEIGKTKEKRIDIARHMFWLFLENELTVEDIDEIILHIDNNPFYFKENDIWKSIEDYFKKEKYVNFFRGISNLTPSGLNTSPNACCGKFELLYRLLRPLSRQPDKGDICDNGENIELKGEEVRISSSQITGKNYNKITQRIFEKHISGNIIKSGGLKGIMAFEIEKKQYYDHYNNEFKKCSKQQVQELFSELLCSLLIDFNNDDLQSIFDSEYNQKYFQKLLMKDWFNKYKKNSEFTKMIIFGNGTDVKIIESDFDLDKLEITNDYFRINQNANIGWYIK